MKTTIKRGLTVLMILLVTCLQANTLYTATSGDWFSPTTWSTVGCGDKTCKCIPGNGDVVIICNGMTVTSNIDIYIGSGGNAATLTIMQGGTLSMGNNYLDVKTGGTMNVSGNLVVDSMLFDNNSVVNITSTGNVTVYGGFKNKNNSNSIVIDGTMDVYGNAFFGWGSTITGNGTVIVGGSSYGTGYVYCNLPGCSACSFTNNCLLPIKLIAFTASFNNTNVDLQWATATEINNKYFTIERSNNGTVFTTLASVNGAGNTSVQHNYAYTDVLPENGVDYYRLKQTDYDGNSTYSQVIATDVNLPDKALTIIPNPAQNSCLVTFYDNNNETFQLSVYDYTGREVITRNVLSVKGANAITLDLSSLAAGLYFVALPVNGTSLNARVVKQ